jgi:hypothetical protein
MSSPPRTSREEERRLNLRTLVIASAASATAALVTSRLWIAGTWIAAAMTPVIVALVSELLHRPTERISRGLTSDSPALPDPEAPAPEAPARRVAERMRADAPLRGAPPPDPLRPDPDALRPDPDAPVRIYRTEATRAPAGRKRQIAYRAVLVTAGLAFAIGAIGLTVTELIAGNSLGKSDRRTTLIPTHRHKSTQDNGNQTNTTPAQTDTTQQPTTTDETAPQTDTETTPTTTTAPSGEPTTTSTTPTTTSP